jgi:hypothetical protein
MYDFQFSAGKHVIECIIKRPQIRVDFLAEIAGQEAQALTCFDGRTRQHYLQHFVLAQCCGRGSHCQIGFACPGGTDGKDDVIRPDLVADS